MAGTTEVETKSAIGAIENIALRFGSTRALVVAMYVYLVRAIGPTDIFNTKWYMLGAFLLVAGILVSYHFSPHTDRTPSPSETK